MAWAGTEKRISLAIDLTTKGSFDKAHKELNRLKKNAVAVAMAVRKSEGLPTSDKIQVLREVKDVHTTVEKKDIEETVKKKEIPAKAAKAAAAVGFKNTNAAAGLDTSQFKIKPERKKPEVASETVPTGTKEKPGPVRPKTKPMDRQPEAAKATTTPREVHQAQYRDMVQDLHRRGLKGQDFIRERDSWLARNPQPAETAEKKPEKTPVPTKAPAVTPAKEYKAAKPVVAKPAPTVQAVSTKSSTPTKPATPTKNERWEAPWKGKRQVALNKAPEQAIQVQEKKTTETAAPAAPAAPQVAPPIEVPKIEAPKIEAPEITVPKIETPKIEIDKTPTKATPAIETKAAPAAKESVNEVTKEVVKETVKKEPKAKTLPPGKVPIVPAAKTATAPVEDNKPAPFVTSEKVTPPVSKSKPMDLNDYKKANMGKGKTERPTPVAKPEAKPEAKPTAARPDTATFMAEYKGKKAAVDEEEKKVKEMPDGPEKVKAYKKIVRKRRAIESWVKDYANPTPEEQPAARAAAAPTTPPPAAPVTPPPNVPPVVPPTKPPTGGGEPTAEPEKKPRKRAKESPRRDVKLAQRLLGPTGVPVSKQTRARVKALREEEINRPAQLEAMGYKGEEKAGMEAAGKAGTEKALVDIAKGISRIVAGFREQVKRKREETTADIADQPLFRKKEHPAEYKGYGEMTREEKDEYYKTGKAPVKKAAYTEAVGEMKPVRDKAGKIVRDKETGKPQMEFVPEKVPEEERYEGAQTQATNQRQAKNEAAALMSEQKRIEGIRAKEAKVHRDYFETQGRKTVETRKKYDKLTNSFKSAGIRLGWLGYRMVTIGKLMMRWLTSPIIGLIKSIANFQQSMADLGLTMGYMEAMGLGSSNMLNTFWNTLEQLPEAGMMMAAALGSIAGVLLTIGVQLAPILAPAIISIADAFLKVWQEAAPTVVPMLQNFVSNLLPRLLSIIQEVGPAFITNFVNGLILVGGAFMSVLEAAQPFIPFLGSVLGVLVGLSPLLVIVGTGLFMLSLPFQLLGSVMGVLPGIMGLISGGLGGMVTSLTGALAPVLSLSGATGTALSGSLLSAAGAMGITGGASTGLIALLGPLIVILGPIIAIIATLAAWWNELTAVWNSTVGPAISRLMESLSALFGGVDLGCVLMTALKVITAPIAAIFAGIMWVVGKLVDVWTLFVDAIRIVCHWLGDVLKPAFDWIYNAIKPLIDAIMGFYNALKGAWDWLNKGWDNLVGNVHKTADEITGVTDAANKVPAKVNTAVTTTTTAAGMPSVAGQNIPAVDYSKYGISQADIAKYTSGIGTPGAQTTGIDMSKYTSSMATMSSSTASNLEATITDLKNALVKPMNELGVFAANILKTLTDSTGAMIAQFSAVAAILNKSAASIEMIRDTSKKTSEAMDRPNESTFYTTVNFNGPISSNADMGKIVDTVNKAIAEQLRRRKMY